MKKSTKSLAAIIAASTLALTLAGCAGSEAPNRDKQLKQSTSKFDDRVPPDVTGEVEYDNYMKAQELYDDPSSIIWCTMFPASPAAPIVTVPIRGKLTSSSVSYYPNQSIIPGTNDSYGRVLGENQSVDGMFHGSPPPYRYGFTPSGQYVDFFEIPTFCTTALTEFGRETLSVTLK